MNCETSFPINIKSEKNQGNCSSGCDLHINYHTSSCVASNKDNHLSLKYDIITQPPVIINNEGMDAYEVRIYSPSLNKFEGSSADAELIILHKSSLNNRQGLAICIPIRENDSMVNNSNKGLLTEIIDQSALYLPISNSPTENTQLQLSEFNLNQFIPIDQPFIHYRTTIPFIDCTLQHICVFGNRNDYIPIHSKSLKMLKGIISPHNYTSYHDNYFINNIGVKGLNDDAVIRCFHEVSILDLNNASTIQSEGFTNIEQLIEKENSINIVTIGAVIVGVCGVVYFASKVVKCKK